MLMMAYMRSLVTSDPISLPEACQASPAGEQTGEKNTVDFMCYISRVASIMPA